MRSSDTYGLRAGASVDDLAALTRKKYCQPLPPGLQRVWCQPCPFSQLADHPEGLTTAVRTCGIAGELLVGDVGVILKRPRRLNGVHTRCGITLREICGDLGGQTSAVDQCGEVDVVHEDLGTVVRGITSRQEFARTQIRDGAVEERAVVEGVRHAPLLQLRPGRIGVWPVIGALRQAPARELR